MADDTCGVAVVLCGVRGVDLVVDVGVGLLHKGDVFVDSANLEMALMALLSATKPGGIAPADGAGCCFSYNSKNAAKIAAA